MSLAASLHLMAHYNQWMNEKLYAAVATLPDEAIAQERGAFFGSLLGTLNHLAVADTLWLKRFATNLAWRQSLAMMDAAPTPMPLRALLYPDFAGLRRYREQLDALILAWAEALGDDDLEYPLEYINIQGEPFRRRSGDLLLHFFNHQTHHRGQATTLLNQAGVDVGVTDLVALLPVTTGES